MVRVVIIRLTVTSSLHQPLAVLCRQVGLVG